MVMVKVKLIVSRSGEDGAFSPGDEIMVPENEVPHMLAAGQCVVVGKTSRSRSAVIERAVPPVAAEKAI